MRAASLVFIKLNFSLYFLLMTSITAANAALFYFLDTLHLQQMIGVVIGTMIGSLPVFLNPLHTMINGYSPSPLVTLTSLKYIPILFYYSVEFFAFDKHEVTKWCEDQCEGKYVIAQNYVFFKKSSDATLFRLTQ